MKKVLTTLLLTCCALLTASAQTKQLDSIYNAVEQMAKEQQWEETARLANRYCALCDTATPSLRHSVMLARLAESAFNRGRRGEAIRLGQQVIDLRRRLTDVEKRHLANALNMEAVYLSYVGKYEQAIPLGEEAVAIYQQHAYTKDKQYGMTQSTLASLLISRGEPDDYKRAMQLCEEALKVLKRDTKDGMNTLNNLAICYAKCGQEAKAADIGKTVLKKGRKVYADNLGSYAVTLSNHVARLARNRSYTQALEYADEARQIFTETGNTRNFSYVRLLLNCANIHKSQEDFDKAIERLKEADTLLVAFAQPSNDLYIQCISELSIVYGQKGDKEKAEFYTDKLASLSKSGDKQSARQFEKQAASAATQGHYKQAIQLEAMAVEALKAKGSVKDYAAALNSLANYQIKNKQHADAIASARLAVDTLQKSKIADLALPDALNTLGLAYFQQHDANTASLHAAKAVELYRQMGDSVSSHYAKCLANLALYHYDKGDTLQAIGLAEKAKDVQLAVLGADHPDNAQLFFNLACFNHKHNSAATLRYYHDALQLQTRDVRNNFSHLTSSEREDYWNRRSYTYKLAPTLLYANRGDRLILADAYNAQLFTKGLLLNSEINFQNFLQQTGDTTLINQYDRLAQLHRDIESAYNLPPAERAERIGQLSAEAATLEKQLVKGCKQFGNFMQGLEGDFHVVADALKDDEVAIEFVNLDVRGFGDTYGALYLRKGWNTPRYKMLFADVDLDEIGMEAPKLSSLLASPEGINEVYGKISLGQLVWGKLLPELSGVKTIYFSPTGMLYQLGIENLAIDATSTITDHFDCHRLSSTRLVANRPSSTGKYGKAAIYGGFNYDMDAPTIERYSEIAKADANAAPIDTTDIDLDNFLADINDATRAIDSLSIRGGVSYLPGTEKESSAIMSYLLEKEVEAKAYQGDMGVEETFKTLDGRNTELIHIATHGFAFTASELSQQQDFASLLRGGGDDNPLNRTGLLFAGANHSIKGGQLPKGVDNGILTAREISLVDLSGARLVVLSACRTGVGEVRDDGVFGLQRGFKKAGAETLLMSLWSVSDEATMTMMKAFYAALVQGHPKHEAFHMAQKAVRDVEGFNSPYFWASFVMLDDL